jgi:hypothetical protein
VASLPSRGDADQARGVAFDGGEQDLAGARGSRDGRQPAQPGFGVAGIGVRVDEPPMRLRAVNPLVDVLPHRSVKAAVAFGKAADPEVTAATR